MSNNDQEFETRLGMIKDIIRLSREYLASPQLDQDRLTRQALAFFPKLQAIPTNELWACFEAATDEGLRSPIQPINLLTAWRDRKPPEIDKGPVVINGQITFKCPHCEDLGFQTVRRATGGTAARACSCEKAPAALRNDEPCKPPFWTRDRAGFWIRVDAA